MPENIASTLIMILFVCIWVFAMISFIVKTIKNKYAPTKTVQAVVIDKHRVETFSKYPGNGKREKCVVVFSVEGKKLSFYVSDFSFDGYKVNEKGTLKYKGDKIIAFK